MTALRKFILSGAALLLCAALLLAGVSACVDATMPPYRNSAGDDNHTEKITGLWLLKQSAAREDNLIIYGSSELRTTEISTHPANFFAGGRAGFQVNLVGRGSCQSIIHAISIAASGESLRGAKVVLITSPQSYVEEGIAPDLFMANFSPQQYLELLAAEDISPEVKAYLSARVLELVAAYEEEAGPAPTDPAVRYLAAYNASPNAASAARNLALTPYYALLRYLYDLDDRVSAGALLRELDEAGPAGADAPAAAGIEIDWEAEERAALAEAARMTSNNSFGMLDDYYTTYIGTRLARQEGMDADLDYSVSKEYDDLRVLLEICGQKGIEPLFVHVPLHGEWSDYTGFSAERRQSYYDNVREIVAEYGVEMLDLTGYEYEAYFLCDVMHLGWRGWLEVDRALVEFYHGG